MLDFVSGTTAVDRPARPDRTTRYATTVFAVRLLIAAAALTAAPLLPGQVLIAQSSPPDSVRRLPQPPVLAPVSVTVSRDAGRSPFELPFATFAITPDSSRPGLRKLSVADLLLGVPGVVVQERSNPSQDPRIAIRGFGARSAFGVRGVKVLRDGIPLSLPDGQTPIDWLDLETVGRIDVVRGTAAALYGNAAGGVVNFRSAMPVHVPLAVSSRISGGAGYTRTNLSLSGTALESRSESMAADSSLATSGGTAGVTAPETVPPAVPATVRALNSLGWLASATGIHGDGSRDWSRLDASSAFARVFANVRGTRVEVQGSLYDAARAENTGALTIAELYSDPTLADSLNIRKNSRKAVRHSQIALLASRTDGDNDVSFSAFTSSRQLDNPLAFAIVDVDRRASGISLRGTRREQGLPWPLRFTVGGDYQQQNDHRTNLENCSDVLASPTATARCPSRGVERGALRLDQRELISSTGFFGRLELEAPHHVFVSAAVRTDRIAFDVRDAFVTATNADDSGTRVLESTSPMFGLVWRARPLFSMYANVASAFETPTVTELTNQEDGAAGLNANLSPQRTLTVEVGAQSIVSGFLLLDIAAFRSRVRDELVPYDVPNMPGRRAFRNAGRTSRDGVETSVRMRNSIFDSGLSYSYSHFRFDQYTNGSLNFAGNQIPGVPVNQVQAWTTVTATRAYATIDMSMASRSSAADAANVFAPGFAVWNARGGYRSAMLAGRVSFEPTAGIDNVFDRKYARSVVVNATRARFYEPGLRRQVWVGVRVGAQ